MAGDDRAGCWFDLVGAEMTDIRERLREARRMPFREKYRCLFTQSDNEIGRLRKALEEIALRDEEFGFDAGKVAREALNSVVRTPGSGS